MLYKSTFEIDRMVADGDILEKTAQVVHQLHAELQKHKDAVHKAASLMKQWQNWNVFRTAVHVKDNNESTSYNTNE